MGKLFHVAVVVSLVTLMSIAPSEASGLSGTKCSVKQLNKTITYNNYKYTCFFKQNKYAWGKGIKVGVNRPTPSKSPQPPSTSKIPQPKYSSQFMQVSPMRITGLATPGGTLTIEGGDWIGPYTPKITYLWVLCRGGLPQDYRDGFAEGPAFFNSWLDIDFRSKTLC